MSTCSGQSQVPMKETVAREAGVVLRGTGQVTQTGVRLHLGLRVGEERPVRVGLGQAGWRWWHWQVKAGETRCERDDGEVVVAPDTGAQCREAGGFWDSSDAWASGLGCGAWDGGGSGTGKPGPSPAGGDGAVGAAVPSTGGHLGHCGNQPGVTQGHPRSGDPEEDWPGFFLVLTLQLLN